MTDRQEKEKMFSQLKRLNNDIYAISDTNLVKECHENIVSLLKSLHSFRRFFSLSEAAYYEYALVHFNVPSLSIKRSLQTFSDFLEYLKDTLDSRLYTLDELYTECSKVFDDFYLISHCADSWAGFFPTDCVIKYSDILKTVTGTIHASNIVDFIREIDHRLKVSL